MNEPARRYSDPATVATQLAELGLKEEYLSEAIAVGVSEANRTTENDPRITRGFTQWAKTYRGLCEQLIAKEGWHRGSDRAYPTVVNPLGTIAITVMGGDANTGRDLGPNGPEPQSRRPKGPISRQVIDRNQIQFADIWADPSLPRAERPPDQTWVLLHYTHWETGETRAELSLPIRMEADDHIVGWRVRIIIGPIAGEPAPLSAADDDDDEGPMPAVERKTS